MTDSAYEQAKQTVRLQARLAGEPVRDLDTSAGTEAFDALADRLGG